MNDADTGIEKEAVSFGPLPDTPNQKILEVKYTISGSSFKTQSPMFEGGTAEDLLHFLYKFNQTQTRLGYTTHQKLESSIEQLIKDTARNEWNTIKSTVSPNTNIGASFALRIEALCRIYIPEPSAVENQKMYLR